jgi:hypothetical protein
VICQNQSQADDAQSKLDAGKGKMLMGLLVATAGVVLTGVGFNRQNRVKALEEQGRRSGFVWNVEFKNQNEPTVSVGMLF